MFYWYLAAILRMGHEIGIRVFFGVGSDTPPLELNGHRNFFLVLKKFFFHKWPGLHPPPSLNGLAISGAIFQRLPLLRIVLKKCIEFKILFSIHNRAQYILSNHLIKKNSGATKGGNGFRKKMRGCTEEAGLQGGGGAARRRRGCTEEAGLQG